MRLPHFSQQTNSLATILMYCKVLIAIASFEVPIFNAALMDRFQQEDPHSCTFENQRMRKNLSSMACCVCAVVSLLAGDELGSSSKSIVDGRVCTSTGSHQELSGPRCHAMKLAR